ncbi:amidohydrolase family protein [Glaciihabitans sp. INWT7]|uniref:amidohydrolase family protein n=1 Tax=Glaciihabitans sp. INWT7 TaxID=2596912 RepID=UPI001629F7C6|nr:amidohydrolase family protein [Glaciihabitans sp. INWT7]QNE46522.1 amidohydrolase family protein [Glaciihabitans sp. INWT7]
MAASFESSDLAQFVGTLGLVDHHVHGAFREDGTRDRFENALNEASTDPLPSFVSGFDSQLGFAVRRWCSPLLDLEPSAPAEVYWARREALGEAEVNRRFLTAAGVSDWMIDTGFASGSYGLDEMATVTGARVHEIVRLETIAESIIASGADDYAERFRAAITAAIGAGAIGTKSVIAYRTGFDVELSRPSDASVATAASAWSKEQKPDASPRLIDPVLLVFGLYAAVDAGLPIQFHVGFGDRDLDLQRTSPMLLLPFLRTAEVAAVPILLLHCYPFEREAGYLAQAFGNVYLDVGLSINYLGARSTELVARSFELAPFAKVLYSSDAWGPSELHFLGAQLWRNAISRVFGDWVERGEWSLADAKRVAELSARGNALRLYGVPQTY